MPHITISTWLTLARLIISPLFLPLLIVYFLPIQDIFINFAMAIVFTLFVLTDFFDGYLARKYCQVTTLGKILDPIADKFLTYSTLIALLAIHKIYFYWVVLLIGREFFVMGLRLIAAEHSFTIPVSNQGKFKTCVQMVLLIFLIVNPYQQLGLIDAFWWNITESFLLCATLVSSVISAYTYYQSFMKTFFSK